MCVIIKISNIQSKMSSTILEQEIFKFQEALMRTGQYWFNCRCCEKIILSGEDDTYENREEVEGEYICGDCIETKPNFINYKLVMEEFTSINNLIFKSKLKLLSPTNTPINDIVDYANACGLDCALFHLFSVIKFNKKK